MHTVLILSIRAYQYLISPDKGLLRGLYPFRGACAMYPSCSEYMILAIEKYGSMKGFYLGIRRIGRCHPFQKNLVDIP
jgi:hypothetical protein